MNPIHQARALVGYLLRESGSHDDLVLKGTEWISSKDYTDDQKKMVQNEYAYMRTGDLPHSEEIFR